jgi:hypothetical protein
MKNIALILIVLFCFSCTKEEDDKAGFQYLDLDDAYGIVLGKYISGTDTSLKLFKLNKTDNLEPVKYLSGSKGEVYTNREPVALYNLNNSYFLVTFKYGKQGTKESFLIRRVDGYVQQLPKAVSPELNGNIDTYINALRGNNYNEYFYTNSEGNWKLDLRLSNLPTVTNILSGEDLGNYFTVDYLGNILSQKKIYLTSGNSVDFAQRNSNYVYPLQGFSNTLYYMFQSNDSIRFSLLDLSTETVAESTLAEAFKVNTFDTGFVGSYAFAANNRIVALLSGAMYIIENKKAKQIDLVSLSLKKIFSGASSNNYCFIYGENIIGQKVFVRINMTSSNLVFTQMLAPNEVEIKYFSASTADNLIFSAIRISDSKKLFGYIPVSGSNWIIDDDEGISETQVLVK